MSDYQGSGFLNPRAAQDEITLHWLPVDPTQLLAPLVTPGLPIAATRDSTIRGRSQAEGTIQRHYVSKGVLPL